MRRLPPAFVIAFVVQGLISATRIGIVASGNQEWLISAYWGLTAQGVGLVTLALLAAGAFELARRSASPASAAARAGGFVFLGGVGLTIVSVLVDYLQMTRADGAPPYEILYDIEAYLWSATMVAGIITLAIAGGGWRRSPALAMVAAVGVLVSRAPPVISHQLFEILGRTTAIVVTSLAWLLALGAMVALVARAELAEPAEDVPALERGLRRTAAALWIRVIAAALFALIAMFALVVRRGGGAISMIQFAMIAGPVLNAFALGSFGVGAFTAARSGVRDISSYTLYVAGALSLWASGAMLVQLPWLYQLFYRDERGGYSAEYGREIATAFSLGIPLVAAVGVVTLTIAIAGFARRRDLQELRDQASSRAGAFVVLIIVSMLIAQYGLPKARTEGMFLAMSLAAAAAGLCAIVVVARLCTLAGDAVHMAPGLPTATLREPE